MEKLSLLISDGAGVKEDILTCLLRQAVERLFAQVGEEGLN